MTDAVLSKPRLAPEITDIILDHLHADKPTLSACSTVCQGWLNTARFHLFREITIYRFFKNEGEGFNAFVTFLRNTPSVRSYICSLTLTNMSPAQDVSLSRDKFDYFAIIYRGLLLAIFENIPRLHTLILIKTFWVHDDSLPSSYSPPMHPLCNNLTCIPPLRKLMISSSYDNTDVTMLTYFTSLQELHLNEVSTIGDHERNTATYPSLNVGTFRAINYNHGLSKWISVVMLPGVCPSLRSLTLPLSEIPLGPRFRHHMTYFEGGSGKARFNWLHDKVAPHLHDLELLMESSTLQIVGSALESSGDFVFGTCVNLSSLTFSKLLLSPPRWGYYRGDTWAFILHCLQNIPLANLKMITVNFDVGRGSSVLERLRMLDWVTFRRVWEEHELKGRIKFNVTPTIDAKEKADVLDRMRWFLDRQLL